MSTASRFFVTGGTLPPDATSYVERQADKDLLSSLLAGEFCYVLNSRQMGKSSLSVRTIAKLGVAGVQTAFVDLTRIGAQNVSVEQWYAGLLAETGRSVGLRSECLRYWKESVHLPPLQRYFGSIREVLLPAIGSNLVIFVDEIDAVRSLSFSADEFFAAVRACYNSRTEDSEYYRLTFCLVGSATPADLISDARMSPFNIGQRIELRDFTFHEMQPLGEGISTGNPGKGDASRHIAQKMLLERIFYWTNGHPYLTQRLCRACMENKAIDQSQIDRLCSELFLTHSALESDDNLSFVRNRMLRSETDLASLLDLYAKIRNGKTVVDDETNPLSNALKLSGVARSDGGQLKIRNRIYENIFDKEWVLQHTPGAELRRQRQAFRKGVVRTAAIATAVIGAMLALTITAIRERNRAEAATGKAEAATRKVAAEQLITERLNYVANMQLLAQANRGGRQDRAADILSESASSPFLGFEWTYWKRISQRGVIAVKAPQDTLMIPIYSMDASRITAVQVRTNGLAAGVLDAATGKALFTIPGIYPDINFTASDRLVTTGVDKDKLGPVKIWDRTTGKLLQSIPGAFASAAVSEDGLIAVTSTYLQQSFRPFRDTHVHLGQISLWSLPSRRQIATLPETMEMQGLSRDGSTLVTTMPGANHECTVASWDTRSGRRLAAWTEHGDSASILLSPDSKLALVGPVLFKAVEHDTRYICIRDLKSGRLIAPLEGATISNMPRYSSFSPDGKTYADLIPTGSTGTQSVRLWDIRTGRLKGERSWPLGLPKATTGTDNSINYSKNGRYLFLREGTKRRVTRVDLTRKGPVKEWETSDILDIAISPDGSHFTAFALSGLQIYDARNQSRGEELSVMKPGRKYGFDFVTDEGVALDFNRSGMTEVRDIASGNLVRNLTRADLGAASPDGSQVVLYSTTSRGKNDGTGNSQDHRQNEIAKVWDIHTGRIIHSLDGARLPISEVMWSPDGRYIVTRSVPGKGSSTGELCIWNAANGVMVHTLPNVPGDLIFSQDGRRILLHDQTNSHSVSVFDLETGLSIFVTPKGAQVAQASFLGGDRMLLLNYQSSEKEEFHSFVLGLPGGRELYRLSQGTTSFLAVASPDGSAYLVVGVDPRISLFDSATGRKLNTYTEPHTFDAPVFTRDGKRIGIYSGQSCTFVDVATGRETLSIPLPDGPDRAIHFSPHGSMMYRLPRQTDVATSELHAWDLRSHPDD